MFVTSCVATGLLNLWKLDRMSQLISIRQTLDHNLYYTIGRHWTFSRELHQRAAIEFPMIARLSVSGFGNTSFDEFQTYQDASIDCAASSPDASAIRGEPLISLVYRVVNVHPEKHVPMKLPDDAMKALSGRLVPGDKRFPAIRPPTVVPSPAFSCRIRVRYADIDAYQHTNTSSYIKFALECAAHAAEAGFYTSVKGDPAFYRVKTSSSMYLMESGVGDELTMSTWEHDENKMLLNFAAINKQNKIIYFTSIEFFDNDNDSLEAPAARL